MRPKVERQFIVFAVMALLAVVIINNSSGGLPSFNSVGTPQATAATDDKSATPLSGSIQVCCTQEDSLLYLGGEGGTIGGGGGGGGYSQSSTSTSTTATEQAQTTNQEGVSSSETGIIVPLYMSPGSVWNALISDKDANPTVPVIAVVNPSSGVGPSKQTSYVSGVASLQKAGILVLGYDWSNYGVIGGGGDYYTSTADIENNMTDYTNWYHVNGTFFDGMAYTSSYESDYQTWVSFASGLGQTYTMGNPGTDTLAGYVGITNSINIYENPSLPSISFLGGWHVDYAKSNFALIAYDVSSTPSQSYIDSATQYVGYLYVSDQGDGYQTLPSYMSAEMQELAIANSG